MPEIVRRLSGAAGFDREGAFVMDPVGLESVSQFLQQGGMTAEPSGA